jgi:hypothetical protein
MCPSLNTNSGSAKAVPVTTRMNARINDAHTVPFCIPHTSFVFLRSRKNRRSLLFCSPPLSLSPRGTTQPWRNTTSVLSSSFLNKSFGFFPAKRIFSFTEGAEGKEEIPWGGKLFRKTLYERNQTKRNSAFRDNPVIRIPPGETHSLRNQGRRRYLFKGRPTSP